MLRLIRQLLVSLLVGSWLAACPLPMVQGQSSSLFLRAAANCDPASSGASGGSYRDGNSLHRVSLIAVTPLPKRIFKVGDLVTVIVRQKSSYKHDSKSDLSRKVDMKAEIKDWIRMKGGRLIPANMPEGKPKLEFTMDRSFEGAGKKSRKDEVVTRITCRVINVLPNGCLVLEGKDNVKTDGEEQLLSLTGTCRNEDISADNTILSTQLLHCNFNRQSAGSVRDAGRRGWAYKIWDILRPF